MSGRKTDQIRDRDEDSTQEGTLRITVGLGNEVSMRALASEGTGHCGSGVFETSG